MPLSINSLDDEVVTDETPLFSAGQISNTRPANIPPNGAFLLENWEISTTGRLITRRGTERLGDAFDHAVYGIAFYRTADDSKLIAFVDDGTFVRLKEWSGTAWIDPVGGPYGIFTEDPLNVVQGDNEVATHPTLYITQTGFDPAYWDGDLLNAITPTADKPAYCSWHTNRLVLAGFDDFPQKLSFSQFLKGTEYDDANWDMDVGAGDGDHITGLCSWTNFNLVVFKEHSVWVVTCNPSLLVSPDFAVSVFPVNQIHRQIGCIAANTAVQVGADIFFLSDSGVRSVLRTQSSDSQSEIGPALSDPVDDIIQRINPAAVKFASAYYWKNKYMLSIPVDDADFPNYTLVFNTLTQTWSGFWTGWQPMCWTRWIDGSTPKLIFGQGDGSITNFLDFTDESSETETDFEDQEVAYPTVLESRAFTCGDQHSPKTGLSTFLEFLRSTSVIAVSAIAGRNETPQLIATIDTSGGDTLTLPFTLPAILPSGGYLHRSLDLMALGQWREIRIRVESSAGKIALNQVGVNAFVDALRIQS